MDDVRSIFQTLMPQLRVFVDKRLNAITLKAKPTDLTIAKRIVSQLDKAKAEVMIYLELLEVTENSMEQVGLLPVLGLSDGLGGGSGIYRVGATLDNTGGPNVNKGAIRINKADLRFLFPSLALDALKSTGRRQAGGQPQRARDLRRDRAKSTSARRSPPPSPPSASPAPPPAPPAPTSAPSPPRPSTATRTWA